MIYKCINSFTDTKGKYHRCGQKIDNVEYNRLLHFEQNFYKREEDSYNSPGGSEFNDDTPWSSSFDYDNTIDSSTIDSSSVDDTDNDTSDDGSLDFGGGDGGGGGSTDSW